MCAGSAESRLQTKVGRADAQRTKVIGPRQRERLSHSRVWNACGHCLQVHELVGIRARKKLSVGVLRCRRSVERCVLGRRGNRCRQLAYKDRLVERFGRQGFQSWQLAVGGLGDAVIAKFVQINDVWGEARVRAGSAAQRGAEIAAQSHGSAIVSCRAGGGGGGGGGRGGRQAKGSDVEMIARPRLRGQHCVTRGAQSAAAAAVLLGKRL
ncbi:hypothetical protein CAOG_009558 [Capsaspora owczarzaki ATCC 30864]|uniref:Uncharacterized protein n=1 Tax=Capsaspora owczarzaki (strain ATCC 30864) TaxID=595528 RepID=A0A0D2X1T7_CAPO3|nr:hypothetical protein CAOG_009558 [Capsaspora owczarzaki ATCC 30864]